MKRPNHLARALRRIHPTNTRCWGIALAALLTPLVSVAQTNKVIPILRLEDRTLTNARVIKATSTGITVMHSGGGETIRRSELPDDIQERFPPTTTTDLKTEKSELTRAYELNRERRTQVLTDQVLRERRTEAALETARKELQNVNELIAAQFPAARITRFGSPERQALAQSLKRRVTLVQQIQAIESSLELNRKIIAESR